MFKEVILFSLHVQEMNSQRHLVLSRLLSLKTPHCPLFSAQPCLSPHSSGAAQVTQTSSSHLSQMPCHPANYLTGPALGLPPHSWWGREQSTMPAPRAASATGCWSPGHPAQHPERTQCPSPLVFPLYPPPQLGGDPR